MTDREITTVTSSVRGVALQAVLQGRTEQDLRELLSFWDGHGPPPDTYDRLVGELQRRMSNEKSVRKRTKFLSKKLVDLLKFFLRGEGYRADLAHVNGSRSFSYLSPFELKAAVNALIKRGFLFVANGGGTNGHGQVQAQGATTEIHESYLVPCELGDLLQAFIWDDDRTVEETFTLRGQLARLVERRDLGALLAAQTGSAPADLDHARAAELLAEQEAVSRRLAAIDNPRVLEILRLVVTSYGGTASRTMLERNHKGLGRWNRKALQEVLESQMLGTVRHLSLGEYGIHQFDEVVVVFAELVESLRACLLPEPPRLSAVRSLGVDLISDISAFLSFVEHNPIRLTLSGKVYRTAVRKLEESFILSRNAGLDGAWLFQYLFDFCQSQSMIERGGERAVVLTVKGRSWDRTPLEKKLSRLLKFACGNWVSVVESFHGERLLELYLEQLGRLKIGEWVDVNAPAFAARNYYLASLDRFGVRDRYQSRYQFAQQSGMRDPHQLALALSGWARERLHLFGLVDLADVEGQPGLLRLTTLGAKALGVQIPEGVQTRSAPLIINPDFEIMLFPDGETHNLVTELDRFAERTSSDSVYRYKLSEASIERAVAEGLEPSRILKTLSEHSRVEVPQNVIYSIGQWAEKVKFVSHSVVSLVRGRNKEVVDRILHDRALRPHVLERLSPTTLLMSSDLSRERLAELLGPLGVFLDG
ncbi:MAG: helicase-associated domain-containing protein [Planctomycetota bacterium]